MWVPRTGKAPHLHSISKPKGSQRWPWVPSAASVQGGGEPRVAPSPSLPSPVDRALAPFPHQAPAFLWPSLPQAGSLISVCHLVSPSPPERLSLQPPSDHPFSLSWSPSALNLSQGVPLPLGLLFLMSICLSLSLIISPPVSWTPSLNLGP